MIGVPNTVHRCSRCLQATCDPTSDMCSPCRTKAAAMERGLDRHAFAEHGRHRMGMRSYQHGDEGVVYDPWWRQIECLAARDLHPRVFKMTPQERQAHIDEVIRPLVLRCPPLVACATDHPSQVFGWICAEYQCDRRVMHFLYVRNMWRRQGVATQLMRRAFPDGVGERTIYVTHPTRMMRHFTERWRLRFNPYLVR